MKNKLVPILLALALAGCTDGNAADQTDAMRKRIEELERHNAELERIHMMDKELHQAFPILSNLALDFVRGRTRGDLELLKSVVSAAVAITEEEGSIYGEYTFSDERIRYPLYVQHRQSLYRDMAVQGIGYDEREQAYVLHIREYYDEASGEPASTPVFLNLYIRAAEEGYRIDRFEFDA